MKNLLIIIAIMTVFNGCDSKKFDDIFGREDLAVQLETDFSISMDGRLIPSNQANKKAEAMAKNKHTDLGNCINCHPKY